MRRISIIATAFLTLVSCQEVLIVDKADGAIAVMLENSPVVELVTKSGETEGSDDGSTSEPGVDVSDFNVYITSDVAGFVPINKKYNQMDSVMNVKVGDYTIYADNVTPEASVTGWGQLRYACEHVTKTVSSGVATSFHLACSMVNTAVSVQFVGNFAEYVSEGYKVVVYTEDAQERRLEYTAANTAGEIPAVGYFTPSAYIDYSFVGKNKDGEDLDPIAGRLEIAPATHLTLRFKIKGDESGHLNKPTITVNTDCEDIPLDVEVDPSKIVSDSSN